MAQTALSYFIDVDTHEAISDEVSLVSVGYSEVIPTLFNLLRIKIIASVADGAYETKICH